MGKAILASIFIVVVILILFEVFLVMLVTSPDKWAPDEGVWYCQEIKIQIAFGKGESYAEIDGQKVACGLSRNKHSKYISIYTIEADGAINLDKDALFEGEYVSLNSTEYVLIGVDGVKYTFYRVA